ncbi:MAG: hypothetical protein ACK56I_17125, partial [bacterium]
MPAQSRGPDRTGVVVVATKQPTVLQIENVPGISEGNIIGESAPKTQHGRQRAAAERGGHCGDVRLDIRHVPRGESRLISS